jgi:hypothetical protein
MERWKQRVTKSPQQNRSSCGRRAPFPGAAFTELVLRQLPDAVGSELRTTLDLPLNERVDAIIRDRLAQLRDHNVHNAAAVVIDNASGDVIALVGSADYFATESGQVNGAWAKRSAGSTLKPFTYLLALERGATPATMIADVRTSFRRTTAFTARELQPPLLRPGQLSHRARELAEHPSGQSVARGRRSRGVARAAPHRRPNDTRQIGGRLWPRADAWKLRGSAARNHECVREPGASRRLSAVARARDCAVVFAAVFAPGARLADRGYAQR